MHYSTIRSTNLAIPKKGTYMANPTKVLPVLAITALVSVNAFASSMTDTHSFRLGGYSQDADILITSTVPPLPPIEVDFINDLGMDDSSTSLYASYRWYFTPKWSMSVTYQQLDLDGDGQATKDFNYEGRLYTAGVAISSEFQMDTYLIDVAYSFIRNEKWEVMVGGGIHAFDIDSVIVGEALVTDGTDIIGSEIARVNAEVLAPLPNLRAGVIYGITPKWEVHGSAGWLSLKINEIDGKYTYLDVGTEYRFTERFGVGATYQVSAIDVTSTKGNGTEIVDIEFTGPSIFLTYGF